MLGRSRLPSLAKEGWTRHQEISPFLLKARTGWFVQTPKQFLLNEPPRLRPLRWLRDIFLIGAATPPLPRSIQSCPAGQRQNTQETAPSKTKDLSAQFLERDLASTHVRQQRNGY